jgi:ABC-type xylose transport system permease subunit
VAGAIVIVVALVVFPVLVAIGGLIIAAILGTALNVDGRVRNEDSELLDLNT